MTLWLALLASHTTLARYPACVRVYVVCEWRLGIEHTYSSGWNVNVCYWIWGYGFTIGISPSSLINLKLVVYFKHG